MSDREPNYIDDERGPCYRTTVRDTETGRWAAFETSYEGLGAPYGDWEDLSADDRERVLSEMPDIHDAHLRLTCLPQPARDRALELLANRRLSPALDGGAADCTFAFQQALIDLGWWDPRGWIN